jgi:hypothetical protein
LDGMAKKQRSATGDPSANSSEVEIRPAAEAATVLRPSAETLYAGELLALAEADSDPRPPGWRLSPRAVRSFLRGASRPAIRRKFSGDDSMVERAIVSLSSNRTISITVLRPNKLPSPANWQTSARLFAAD